MAEASPAGSTPPAGDDWPTQAADTIVKVVGMVRDRTAGTAVTAARGVVFGLLAGILGLVAGLLALIGAMRLLIVAIDGVLHAVGWERAGRAVWMADMVVGVILLAAGFVLWKKATAAPAPVAD